MRPTILTLSLLTLATAADAQVLGLNPHLTGSRLGASNDNGMGFELQVLTQPNGDNLVISAAPNADGAAGAGAGRVVIFRTDPGGPMGEKVWEKEGALAGAACGFSVAVLGDQNGDGIPDFAIGSPGINAVEVYSGDAAQGFPLLKATALIAAGTSFGVKILALGDMDGDNIEDLAITNLATFGSVLQSEVRIYRGGLFGRGYLRSYYGVAVNDLFGASVARIPDVDNDQVDDVIIGAPGDRSGAGRAYCYSNKNGALLWSFPGNPYEEFGTSLLGTIDPNNGQPIVFAGGASHFFGQRGAVRAIDGATGNQLGSTFLGNVGARFGRSLAEADATGDKIPDLIVSAPDEDQLYVFRAPSYSLWGVIQGLAGWAYGTDLAVIAGTGAEPDTLVVGAAGAVNPNNGKQTGRVDSRKFEDWQIQADHHQISAATGGSVDFQTNFPQANSGDVYLALVTASGTTPGFQAPSGVRIDLNPDGLTFASLDNLNLLITNQVGIFGSNGLPPGQLSFRIPPLPGLKLQTHTVIVVLNPITGAVKSATPAVPIGIE